MHDNVMTSAPHTPHAPRAPHANLASDVVTGIDFSNPGDQDPAYLARRRHIADITLSYVEGRPVPRVDYSDLENGVWSDVCDHIRPYHERIACQAYRDGLASLGFDRSEIPQLAEMNQKLAATTGFQMIPVLGFVTPRTFLRMLGRGTFLSTQYVRHHSIPEFTPEPDVIHELLGHGPALSSPSSPISTAASGRPPTGRATPRWSGSRGSTGTPWRPGSSVSTGRSRSWARRCSLPSRSSSRSSGASPSGPSTSRSWPRPTPLRRSSRIGCSSRPASRRWCAK